MTEHEKPHSWKSSAKSALNGKIALLLFLGYFQALYEYVPDQHKRKKITSYSWLFFLSLLMAAYYYILLDFFSWALGDNLFKQALTTIVNAATLIMISVGLTLVTRVRKFANFAHAEFVTTGVYVVIGINSMSWARSFGLNTIFLQIVWAFLLTGGIAILGELLVFGPLTKRDATPLTLMVASIGYGLVIRQVIQEIFTALPQQPAPIYPSFWTEDKILSPIEGIPFIGPLLAGFVGLFVKDRSEFSWNTLLGYRVELIVTRNESFAILIMIIIILSMRYMFTKTTLGISMRATADDPDLAQISGIDTQRVIMYTWFIAGGVTGVGAIFRFEASSVTPAAGFVLLLLIFAVVTLGGFDSFEGTLVAAFIVETARSLTVIINGRLALLEQKSPLVDTLVFWETSGDWKAVTAFFIIIVVLIVRPRGIFGLIDPRSKL